MTGTHIVVVGPSGAGKTTIGPALAHTLDAAFVDADAPVDRVITTILQAARAQHA